jgi:hypothetical protein
MICTCTVYFGALEAFESLFTDGTGLDNAGDESASTSFGCTSLLTLFHWYHNKNPSAIKWYPCF